MTATIPPTLPSQYDPATAEAKWQQLWETNHVFEADPDAPGAPYCLMLPPPNVTGSLHMGHALGQTIMDVLVRYHRMIGRNTLWVPGTDHASIAVQTLLEKQLKAEGKTRDQVGREQFLERAWQWKAESGGTIVGQLRRLGVSVDWSRERFTMDAGLSAAVVEAFVQLHQEGLIYRGNYLVNWCPASQSAVSDLEVDNQEVNGHLWHFRYPLTDGTGFIEVATTRPETMLGDTAVAVNPTDDRYKSLIGKTVLLPLVKREIPIIADESVDASFGTGCVKVTPAHDANDFEMGKRHNLPFINILNKDGTLNENADLFEGLDRFVARKEIVSLMESEGFLVKIEDYKHTVPYSDRGKVPIEPLLSTQWFVNTKPLSDRALNALDQQNSPVFVPERWTKVYRDWLVSLKDWCISRQLWWGHQIPAWYAVSETAGEITDTTPFVVARTAAEAREQAIAQFGADVELVQDPDVLDTWFSSGLWPFSTLGWPEETADLERYYPTTTLVTGFDIIFFWVARMTMMAGHFTGKMPFESVYIHGLVRDENNKKMSKSLNNGIDPLLLMNKYGTDALRYTLIREVAGAGQDIRLEYNRKTDESASVEASRNFTNKLWNASRFVLMNLDGRSPAQLGQPNAAALELSDRWILSRFHQVTQQTRSQIEQFGLGEAAKGLYEFFWGDFCDWYIELVKPRLQGEDGNSRRTAQQVLAFVLEGILKLFHPFLPHITEEIWHTLTQSPDDRYLARQPYPESDAGLIDPELEQQFELLIGTIRTIRNLRAEAEIKPGVKIKTTLQTESDRERHILTAGQAYIQDLAKVETLTISDPAPSLPIAPHATQIEPPAELHSAAAVSLETPHPVQVFRWWALAAIGLVYVLQTILLSTVGELSGLSNFWSRYKRLTQLALGLIGVILGLWLVQGTLDAIDNFLLLPTLFELIGIGYGLWFTRRFLLRGTDRQDLSNRITAIKAEVFGPVSRPLLDVPSESLPVADSAVPVDDRSIAGVVGTVQVLIPLTGVVDVDALHSKLQKELSKVEAEITSLTARLSNPGFVDKAPPDVVATARATLAESEKQAEILRDRLDQL
jgi:valyl-tRNA synthetase